MDANKGRKIKNEKAGGTVGMGLRLGLVPAQYSAWVLEPGGTGRKLWPIG